MSKDQKPVFPSWAEVKVGELRELEVHLGHIPKAQQWSSDHIEMIAKKIEQWADVDL